MQEFENLLKIYFNLEISRYRLFHRNFQLNMCALVDFPVYSVYVYIFLFLGLTNNFSAIIKSCYKKFTFSAFVAFIRASGLQFPKRLLLIFNNRLY